MSTDVALSGPSTGLTIEPEQSTFTPQQVSVLRHIGVENASEGDLAVFFHVVKRTGLDPFARQIYMIGRQSSENVNGQWVKTTKQTIQTGIDGYRLIGRRAATRAGESISIGAPEWAHEDGSWRPVWSPKWGTPLAARVIVKRNGEPFEAVALFDEYKQTKRDGNLTQMWAQRPAGQIAKCAEALAWRMAFPQDLAGVYVEDEMHQAANERPEPAPAASGADQLRAALAPEPVEVTVVDVTDAVEVAPEPLTDKTRKQMFALLNDAGITDPDVQRQGMSKILGRTIASRAELTEDDARTVILELQARAA